MVPRKLGRKERRGTADIFELVERKIGDESVLLMPIVR